MNNIQLVDLYAQYKSIKKEIDASIQRIIKTTSFIMGDDVYEFEKEFAAYLGVKYCIAVSSGTDALHLSLLALGVSPGDEVITTPFTFVATAETISTCGARPVFVDIDPQTYNLDPAKIEEKITKKTRGIIPVHLYGQPVDMGKIKSITDKHKLFILEDCAQAHGAEIKMKQWKKVGTIGDAGIFSFYPAKNLGCYGDGGAVVTNDKRFADQIRLLRNHGRSEKYIHQIIGYGCRLDTLQAAILRVKLKYLNEWNDKRRSIAHAYNRLLQELPVITPYEPDWVKAIYHVYAIRTKNRDKVKQWLKEKGIETGIHYPLPLHLQPVYRNLGYKENDFPVAEKMTGEELSLPMYPELSKNQLSHIASAIRQFYEENTRHHQHLSR